MSVTTTSFSMWNAVSTLLPPTPPAAKAFFLLCHIDCQDFPVQPIPGLPFSVSLTKLLDFLLYDCWCPSWPCALILTSYKNSDLWPAVMPASSSLVNLQAHCLRVSLRQSSYPERKIHDYSQSYLIIFLPCLSYHFLLPDAYKQLTTACSEHMLINKYCFFTILSVFSLSLSTPRGRRCLVVLISTVPRTMGFHPWIKQLCARIFWIVTYIPCE